MAPAAWGDGARTIAGAPRAAWGVAHTGTTVDVGAPCPARIGSFFSYWTLRVIEGDRLTIDWGAQQKGTVLSLLPAGTADPAAAPTDTDTLEEMYGKSELNAAPAARSGIVPLQVHGFVCDGGGGPYDFTASVRHAVRLSLPAGRRVRSRVTVTVRTPDGRPVSSRALRVSVQARLRGHWRPAGRASVAHGRARVRLALRPRRRVRLRAVAYGRGYVRARSAARTVRVSGDGARAPSASSPR
jgi:hypothetical protein